MVPSSFITISSSTVSGSSSTPDTFLPFAMKLSSVVPGRCLSLSFPLVGFGLRRAGGSGSCRGMISIQDV